jgi:eukaryotic-like serine/threonine-protein kinase
MTPLIKPTFPEWISPYFDKLNDAVSYLKNMWNNLTPSTMIAMFVVLTILIVTLLILTRVLRNAPSSGAANTKTLIREARRNKRHSMFKRAGELYEMAGSYDDAAKMYHRAEAYRSLGHLYEMSKDWVASAGAYEAGQDLEKASLLYQRAGQYNKAGEVLLSARMESSAAGMFERAGNYAKAAELYERSKYLQKAAACYERTQNYHKAAGLYEQCYHEEKVRSNQPSVMSDVSQKSLATSYALQSGKLYLKTGEPNKAANIYALGGYIQEAAEVYTSINDLAKAAELYYTSKNYLKASDLYHQQGQSDKAFSVLAEMHIDQHNYLEAARMYEKAFDFIQAGDLYEKADQIEKAAEMFHAGGDLLRASELFQTIGNYLKAANALEESKHYREAAQLYIKSNDYEKSAVMFEQAEDFYEAGMIFYQLNRIEDTISFLQKVDTQSEHYLEASLLLARIFMDRGMLDTAKERYKKLVAKLEINLKNLEPFYNLAVIHEKNREFSSALLLYEKIIAENYHYKDVQNRLSTVKTAVHQDKSKTNKRKPGIATQVKGRYHILKKIGQGGMGVVFQANDTLLNRIVAYKVLPPSVRDNPDTLESFLSEARVAAGINHNNIVTVYDTGTEVAEPYIIMEYVDGVSIKQILERISKMPVKDIIEVAKQVCYGLEHAHSKNVIHRDIKPANIMISRDNVIKIMDFGLARMLNATTQEGTSVKGTPLYMSPEQIRGERTDHRTDIYSLGCTLYRMAAGRPPFLDGDVYYHHLHTPPVPPRTYNSQIPDALNEIILKCIKKDPNQRFRTAKEIRLEIESKIIKAGKH